MFDREMASQAGPASEEEKQPFLFPLPPGHVDTVPTPCTAKQRSSLSTRRKWLAVGAVVLVVTALAMSGIVLGTKLGRAAGEGAWEAPTNCGENYTSAVANGCRFQLWSFTWVPARCFDYELHEQYLALRAKEDWQYYLDGTDPPAPVPLESVLVGDRNDLHGTWGQHFWHCAFFQRRFLRMVEQLDGRRSPPNWQWTQRELSIHHAEHCHEWLANPFLYPWDEVRINLTVKFDTCG